MTILRAFLAIVLLPWVAAMPCDAAEKRVVLETSRGVSQSFLLTATADAKAALVLFVGGSGALGLGTDGVIASNDKNFLVRVRLDLAAKGFSVALVDVPSDRSEMSPDFRVSQLHATDILSVLKYLKGLGNMPIWLVGTSMGTVSAASIAVKMQKRIAGLVLASTVTRLSARGRGAGRFPNGVMDLNVQKLSIPVLLLAHQDDDCAATPPGDLEQLKRRFTGSSRAEVARIGGGRAPETGPCAPLSPHGFYGVEDRAVDRIAHFISD